MLSAGDKSLLQCSYPQRIGPTGFYQTNLFSIKNEHILWKMRFGNMKLKWGTSFKDENVYER